MVNNYNFLQINTQTWIPRIPCIKNYECLHMVPKHPVQIIGDHANVYPATRNEPAPLAFQRPSLRLSVYRRRRSDAVQHSVVFVLYVPAPHRAVLLYMHLDANALFKKTALCFVTHKNISMCFLDLIARLKNCNRNMCT